MKKINYFPVVFLIVIGMMLMSATSLYAAVYPINPTPKDNAVNVTEYAILYWDATGNYDYADVYLGTHPDSLSLVEENVDWGCYCCVESNLQPNTDYYWKIYTCIYGSGCWSSSIWHFTTGDKIATAGNALDFDGTDDYVEVPYSETLNADYFTIAFWAKVEDGGQGTYRSPLTSRDVNYKGYFFYAAENNTWEFWVGTGTSWHIITGPPVVIGEWIHLAATRHIYTSSPTTVRLYVNGVSYAESEVSYVPNDSKPLRIGAGSTESTTPDSYFNGVIDNVYIYNHNMAQYNPDHIRELMNYPFHPYYASDGEERVSFWGFNESSGAIAHDSYGANEGTLHNNPGWIPSEAPVNWISNHFPADGTQEVKVIPGSYSSPNFSWEVSSELSTNNCYFFLGTDNPPTNIENETFCTGTHFDVTSNLACDTEHYWRVVPAEYIGQANDYPVYSFITHKEIVDAGKGIKFNNTTDQITINTSEINDSPFNIDFWVKFNEDATGLENLVGNCVGENDFGYAIYRTAENKIRAHVRTTLSVTYSFDSATIVDTTKWYHIWMGIDDDFYLYIDGIEDDNSPISYPGHLINTTGTLYIGKDGVENAPKATIDQVRLWSAVSVNNIADRMDNAITGNEGLLAGWRFDEDSGSTVWDANSKTNGTIYGAERVQSEANIVTYSGILSGTLFSVNSPILIDNRVDVPSGEELSIQPGVELIFTGHHKFVVNGRLLAQGTENDMITFTAQDTDNGWHSLRFADTNANGQDSSKVEYCKFEYGNAGYGTPLTTPDDEGGAILFYNSSNVILENSIFENNKAYYGGAISCCNDSDIDIKNCLVINNSTSDKGAIRAASLSYPRVLNTTISDNTGIGVSAYNTSIDILNSIVWNNSGDEILDSSSTVNVSYSDIQGGWTGTENHDVDPNFIGNGNYGLQLTSSLLNKGTTYQANLTDTDLAGNPRIFHYYPDIGAYECQILPPPQNVQASDGNNMYNGFIRISWDWSYYNYFPEISGFKIYRDGGSYPFIVDFNSAAFYYDDYGIVPGMVHEYTVIAYHGDIESPSCTDTGYTKPNGVITGKVTTPNNNPVAGVQVSISPSPGKALEFAIGDSVMVNDFLTDISQDHTFEFWCKTEITNGELFRKGDKAIGLNTGKLYFNDNGTYFNQQDTLLVNDGIWHHITLTYDLSETKLLFYLDENIVYSDSTATLQNDLSTNLLMGSSNFTGLLDDIRIWNVVRDSTSIFDNMSRLIPWNETGLVGYWPFNEGIGNIGYDGTNNSNIANIYNAVWSDDEPGILLMDYTNSLGEYQIGEINYGYSTTFTVIPFKENHVFIPEQRLVSLSQSNISANNVDFTDNSLITVTGTVAYQSSNCFIEGVHILVDSLEYSPPIITNENGEYVLEVENGTSLELFASYNDHEFTPTKWELNNITAPLSNKDFENITEYALTVNITGGEDQYPIGEFDIEVVSTCECISYSDSMVINDNGTVIMGDLLPLDYNVTVTAADSNWFNVNYNINNDNLFIRNKSVSLSDTSKSIFFSWNAPLQAEIIWPDTVTYTYTGIPGRFKVLQQNECYPIQIKAFEDYSSDYYSDRITLISTGTVSITDNISQRDVDDKTIVDGIVDHLVIPYLPNIASNPSDPHPYQYNINANVQDPLGRSKAITSWALTEGERPTDSYFVTTSPDIPIMILHDPPGDGSYSFFSEETSVTNAMRFYVQTDSITQTFQNVSMGVDFTQEMGFLFFYTSLEVDMVYDYNYNSEVTNTGISETESISKLTTSGFYQTSDMEEDIGLDSDLFVGGAMNMACGLTDILEWDADSLKVDFALNFIFAPIGFASTYMYTKKHIENTVIPDLIEAATNTSDPDSAQVFLDSAANWQNILDTNQQNITDATFVENRSFNAGPTYQYSNTSEISSSYTSEFNVFVSDEYGQEIGAYFNGVGTSGGNNYCVQIQTGQATTVDTTVTTTIGYTLYDNDVSGGDGGRNGRDNLCDYFSVDVKKDQVYATPVFDLIGGVTSKPWESPSLARDGVEFTANTNYATNIPEDEPAVFILHLINTSQTNEERTYKLEVLQATNPTGATVKINGVTLEGAMDFIIPGEIGNNMIDAIMTVERGPLSYECNDLKLEFYAEGDRGNDGPDGHFFWQKQSFDVTWQAPFSRISIIEPADNWLINSNSPDSLYIKFAEYDTTITTFTQFGLQYKHPYDDNWNEAFTVSSDSLTNEYFYVKYWHYFPISDGEYLIRAFTYDSIHGYYYSDPLQGTIDRSIPLVMGAPQPADAILELGDEISVTFTEMIDGNQLTGDNITLENTVTGDPISISFFCYENKILIEPQIQNYYLENFTLKSTVRGVSDLNGNTITDTISWEFFVNRNPVGWNITKLDVIKPLGESMTLTANLINGGGQYYSYVFTDYADSLYHSELEYHAPDWLSITPTSGQLIPLDTQEISFEISDQIGFGHYETIIYAHTPMGNEAIEIEVDVLSNPPDWSITQFNNFQSSMSIYGELNIEGDLSVDVNDIIGVFMQEESGDWVCRGVTNIESVPYIPTHPYQVFMTIYSDIADSVRTEDEIRFRVWDNSDNKEYYQIDHSVFGGTLMYFANDVIGTPLNPVSLATVTDMVQDIPLFSGWTWFSTNLGLVPNTINDVLASLNPIDDDFIKDQQYFSQYFTEQWIGSLTSMNNTSMYKINMANEQTLEIIGELRDPVTTTISYSTGWNWIGYIPHVSMSVNQAMEDRTNQPGDFIKNQNSHCFYVNEDIGWIGSLRFMNPGEGFMLYSLGTGLFNYPEYGSRAFDNFAEYNPVVLHDVPDWSVNPQDFEYTASMSIELLIDGIPATSGNYMIGAFVGEECRGSATPINVGDTWLYFLTVFSNTQNEEISLKVYDADADETIDPDNSFIFTNDLILGSPSDPYQLEISGTLPVPQNIRIDISAGNVVINWDAVSGANSYKVFASNSPDGTFIEVTSDGILGTERDNTINWTATIPIDNRKFYYVVASTETVRDNLNKTSKVLKTSEVRRKK